VIELLGPYGLSSIFYDTGVNIAKLDTGVVTTYSLYFTLGLLSLLFLIFSPILIDASLLSELKLLIIYFYALVLVLSTNNYSSIKN
jgi:NADH-ubiquinone oxidoreductase chain 5